MFVCLDLICFYSKGLVFFLCLFSLISKIHSFSFLCSTLYSGLLAFHLWKIAFTDRFIFKISLVVNAILGNSTPLLSTLLYNALSFSHHLSYYSPLVTTSFLSIKMAFKRGQVVKIWRDISERKKLNTMYQDSGNVSYSFAFQICY